MDDGRPFSGAALARAVGLSRPTIVAYVGTWARAGLLTRVDDRGLPVPHGTPTAPGTAALWRLAGTAWTPERIARMPAEWGPRRALAWACLQLGADDDLVGACLRRAPAANGDRALWAWYSRAVRAQQHDARRLTRAARAAAARADRPRGCPSDGAVEGVLQRLGELAGGISTPPRTEAGSTAQRGLELPPGNALAREARRGMPRHRTEPSAAQLRRVIETGPARDDTEAASSWADVARAAALVAERDPVAVWRQAVRIAATGHVRHRRRLVLVSASGPLGLGDVVGGYQRAVDRVRADILPNAAAIPVTNAAALACHWWRRELVEGDLRADHVADLIEPTAPTAAAVQGPSSGRAGDQVVDVRPEPLYVPEPEPARRLTAADRLAIRDRVQALTGGRPVERDDLVADQLATGWRRVEVGRPRLGAAVPAARPPTQAQLEEARQTAAAGFPVPERYRPWL